MGEVINLHAYKQRNIVNTVVGLIHEIRDQDPMGGALDALGKAFAATLDIPDPAVSHTLAKNMYFISSAMKPDYGVFDNVTVQAAVGNGKALTEEGFQETINNAVIFGRIVIRNDAGHLKPKKGVVNPLILMDHYITTKGQEYTFIRLVVEQFIACGFTLHNFGTQMLNASAYMRFIGGSASVTIVLDPDGMLELN